jgi:error-prone DNA polymerase
MYRQDLLELGAVPMARLGKSEGFVRTAGLVIAKQKPPTANGYTFYVIEDGNRHVQVVINPDVWESNRTTLRDARMLITEGTLHMRQEAWTLNAVNVWQVAS